MLLVIFSAPACLLSIYLAFLCYKKARYQHTMVLTLKTEQKIYEGALYPGAKRSGDWQLTYVAQDVPELMLAYRGMRR